MTFKTKQEQYEWWTQAIIKIQSNKNSIRNGCREMGVPFWQYYCWKERVQCFIDRGEVILDKDVALRRPKGKQSSSEGFVEVFDSAVSSSHSSAVLHFKQDWRLEIPPGYDASCLVSLLQSLVSS